MLSCEVDDPAHSVGGHALEDVGGDLLGGMVVRVLKDCPDRQARALDQPSARNLARDPFNVVAGSPVYLYRVAHGGARWFGLPIVAGSGGRGGGFEVRGATVDPYLCAVSLSRVMAGSHNCLPGMRTKRP
jgi:hypothetical protein